MQMTTKDSASHTLAVAPMMRYSHEHARMLWHLICPQAVLFTEMLPAIGLARNPGRYPGHGPGRGKVILQLAGRDERVLAAAAEAALRLGYDGVNLNCGCPSPRAGQGGFGACMMLNPKLVARGVRAMVDACGLPVSVKCRTGVDGQESTQLAESFVAPLVEAGCSEIILHARMAWLDGLSPKQNRHRPPLEPHVAIELKQEFPSLGVITNGGITTLAQATERHAGVDGVMLGRAIMARPLLLAEIGSSWFGSEIPSIRQVAESYLGYCARQLLGGVHPRRLVAPLTGLAYGTPGARGFRRSLMEAAATGDLAAVAAVLP